MESIEIILGLAIGIPFVILLLLRECKPITNRIAPRVIIEATPGNFVFDAANSHFELEPYLYLDAQQRVVAIGEEVITDVDLFRVDLFKCDDHPQQNGNQGMMLEAFLRLAIRRSMINTNKVVRVLFPRPIVVFRGLGTFAPFLCGYQKYLFDCVLRDLALKVLYE